MGDFIYFCEAVISKKINKYMELLTINKIGEAAFKQGFT
jgi:hypothetical protein